MKGLSDKALRRVADFQGLATKRAQIEPEQFIDKTEAWVEENLPVVIDALYGGDGSLMREMINSMTSEDKEMLLDALNSETVQDYMGVGASRKRAQEEGYQGFKNYGTWVVTLWIENDEGSYNYWREKAQELEPLEGPPSELAQELQEFHEENMPEVSGVYADLLGAALEEVDWFEVAENLLAE